MKRWIIAVAFMLGVTTSVQATEAKAAPAPKIVAILLGGSPAERRNPLDLFGQGSPTLHEIVRTIDRASQDPAVRGLYLRLEFPALGLAQGMEVHSALERFAEAGKPIYTTADALDIVTFTAIAPSTQIVLPPVSDVDLRGIAFSLYYMKDLLEKVGLRADVVHAGDYKDALDPLIRQEMSAATREAMTALMNDLYQSWAEAAKAGRGWEMAQSIGLLQGGPYSSAEALRKGVIDRIADPDVVLAELEESGAEIDWDYGTKAKPAAPSVSLFSLFAAPARARASAQAGAPTIAVVYLIGPIVDGRTDSSNPFAVEEMIATEDTIDLLRDAREDANVVAMVLRVDSPGGSAIASDRIWQEIQLIRSEGLPVVVSMGNVAASGGYYISSAADQILAEPTTITGSIGVIGGKLNMEPLYTKWGVTRQTLTIGRDADLYSETTAWSGEQRALLEGLLNDVYTTFLERVATGREMELAVVREHAGGRVWSGVAAERLGLVDRLGGLQDAITLAREWADSPEASITEFPEELTPMEYLEELFAGGMMIRSQTPTPARSLLLREAIALLPPGVSRQITHILTAFGTDYRVLAISPHVFEVR